MRIFNQEVDGPDTVVSDFIQELLNSPEAKARAHGCNLQHDPRVSKDRATRFWTEIAKAKAATPSKKFSEFAFKHVQSASTPDFLNADNDGNAVANPPQNFVTILNINGLWRMFKWAQENNKDGFKTFEATPDKLKSGIQSRMQSDKRETFLPRVFGLHAEYSQANPYHPVWLACPDDLSCCQGVPVPQKASRLCERVGVSSEEKGGEWVVLLIFSSNKVKRVYRPTCLDSVTEYHFPTPEGLRVLDWLQSEPYDLKRLADWLEGEDGPGIDRYTDGFTWLFKAVDGDEVATKQLASRTAKMLDAYRTGMLSPTPKLASNLLYLCAELGRPEILGEPLVEMLKVQTVPPKGDTGHERSYL